MNNAALTCPLSSERSPSLTFNSNRFCRRPVGGERGRARARGLRRANRRVGYTLVEVAISTLLIGMVLVGGLKLVHSSLKNSADHIERTKAIMLADDLMGEIVQQQYIDDTNPVFGLEISESSTNRSHWDDVDDYYQWDSTPPKERDGTAMSLTGWRRWVTVHHVDPNNLSSNLLNSNDSGVKRIVVNVSIDGQAVATIESLHTAAWVDMIPEPGNDQTTGAAPAGNQPPTASFTATPLTGDSPLTVAFDATGSSDPDNDPLSYSWDFDDDTTSTNSKPSHIFENSSGSPITFNVTLTVTDLHGSHEAKTVSIVVAP